MHFKKPAEAIKMVAQECCLFRKRVAIGSNEMLGSCSITMVQNQIGTNQNARVAKTTILFSIEAILPWQKHQLLSIF